MVSSFTSDRIFQTLRSDSLNNSCFDCGVQNVQYSCISHGSFICVDCANLHESYLQGITQVKALDGSWSVDQLKFMSSGGNSVLRNFFNLYRIPPSEKLVIKYKTIAANYYKQMIRFYALGEFCQMATPPIKLGGRPYQQENKIQESVRERRKIKKKKKVQEEEKKQQEKKQQEVVEVVQETFQKEVQEKPKVEQEQKSYWKGGFFGKLTGNATKLKEKAGLGVQKAFGEVRRRISHIFTQSKQLGIKGYDYVKEGAEGLYRGFSQEAMETYETLHDTEILRRIRDETFAMLKEEEKEEQ